MMVDLSKAKLRHHITVRKWEGGLRPGVDPPLEVVEIKEVPPSPECPDGVVIRIERGDSNAVNASR